MGSEGQDDRSGTRVRAVCPTCGEVTLAIEVIEVQIWPDTGEGTYTFSCPSCGRLVQREAAREVVAVLFSEGVRTRVHEMPTELFERPPGPPISWDDLLDFHTLLESDSWLDHLLG